MSRECPVCHHSMTQILRRHVQPAMTGWCWTTCRLRYTLSVGRLSVRNLRVSLGARASGPLRKQARGLQLPGASRADSQKLNDLA